MELNSMEFNDKIKKMSGRTEALFEQIRQEAPLVHCITNAVAVNDCANMLLAAGARPTMAHHELEVEEVTAGCDSLICNLGADESFPAMLLAAKQSRKLGHPVIVDPVGAGGSTYRRKLFWQLASEAGVTCIRGNASEIRALNKDAPTVTGVDASPEDVVNVETLERNKRIAQQLSKKTGSIVIISGAVDVVTDGENSYAVSNGDAMMSRITGSGCMASAVLGAYLGVACSKKETSAYAAASAMAVLGICGEIAAKQCRMEHRGNMSFRQYFIDAMDLLTSEQIQEHLKIQEI